MTYAEWLPVVSSQLLTRVARVALLCALGIPAMVVPAWAQRMPTRKTMPLVIELDLQDLRQSNLSPLVFTLWSYVTAESRVTESQGFGLSVVPHFGGARVSTMARLTGWAAVGAAGGVLAAHAPNLEDPQLPPEAILAVGYGAAAGIISGELVWQWWHTGTSDRTDRGRPVTIELTVAAVRIEHLSTPIALPIVNYAWVPALVGKW